METIKVEVHWSDKNYSGGWGYPGVGAVLATGKTIEAFKAQFAEALRLHIEGMAEDGEEVPQWLAVGDYAVEYDLDAAALLRQAEEYTSITAISKATGINVKQLSHYANNVKKPRPAQRQRIIDGLREIGRRLIAVI